MKFAIGKKQKMTQIFDMEGFVHPATEVILEKIIVTKICKKEKEGYDAVQIGYGEKKAKQTAKQKDKGIVMFEGMKELYVDDIDKYKIGDKIDTNDIFQKGDVVNVSGISKGKGFAGVVKRHNFGGGPRSHGQKHTERSPGSIGGGLRCRVPRGVKMAGRMGGERITIKGLEIVLTDKDSNKILIKGSLPGKKGTLIEVKTL